MERRTTLVADGGVGAQRAAAQKRQIVLLESRNTWRERGRSSASSRPRGDNAVLVYFPPQVAWPRRATPPRRVRWRNRRGRLVPPANHGGLRKRGLTGRPTNINTGANCADWAVTVGHGVRVNLTPRSRRAGAAGTSSAGARALGFFLYRPTSHARDHENAWIRGHRPDLTAGVSRHCGRPLDRRLGTDIPRWRPQKLPSTSSRSIAGS